jgi:LysM repeat protein
LNKYKFKFAANSYVVRPGDTLNGIAKRYKISLSKLKSLNEQEGNIIHVSDKLIVPPLPLNKNAYVVKSGDNLSIIAKRYKVSVQTLKTRNNKDSDVIKIGEKLRVY